MASTKMTMEAMPTKTAKEAKKHDQQDQSGLEHDQEGNLIFFIDFQQIFEKLNSLRLCSFLMETKKTMRRIRETRKRRKLKKSDRGRLDICQKIYMLAYV